MPREIATKQTVMTGKIQVINVSTDKYTRAILAALDRCIHTKDRYIERIRLAKGTIMYILYVASMQ